MTHFHLEKNNGRPFLSLPTNLKFSVTNAVTQDANKENKSYGNVRYRTVLYTIRIVRSSLMC